MYLSVSNTRPLSAVEALYGEPVCSLFWRLILAITGNTQSLALTANSRASRVDVSIENVIGMPRRAVSLSRQYRDERGTTKNVDADRDGF